jgi:hypothetical protein
MAVLLAGLAVQWQCTAERLSGIGRLIFEARVTAASIPAFRQSKV